MMKQEKRECGRCKSTKIDVVERIIGGAREMRCRCVRCGFMWSEYLEVM